MPKGYSEHNQGGWKHSEKSISKMSISKAGTVANEKNPRWAGDNVSYQALHSWIRRHFKKPNKCESCHKNPGVDTLNRTKLHWANINKKYLRIRKDWKCLCSSCHKQVDVNNKVKHKYARK